MRIPILMPLRDGHYVSSEVIFGIAKQGYAFDVYCVSREGSDDPEVKFPLIAENMNRLVHIAVSENLGPIVVLMNSDRVLLVDDAFARALAEFSADDGVEIVQLSSTPTLAHVDLGCVFLRSDVLAKIHFGGRSTSMCNCPQFDELVTRMRFNRKQMIEPDLISHERHPRCKAQGVSHE